MTRFSLALYITLCLGCSAPVHSQEEPPGPQHMVLEPGDVALTSYLHEDPECFAYSAERDIFACRALWHVNSGLETLAGVEWVSRDPGYQKRARKSWFREAADVDILISERPNHSRPQLDHSAPMTSLEDVNTALASGGFQPLEAEPVFMEFDRWNTVTPELEVRILDTEDEGMSVSIVEVRCSGHTSEVNFTYEGVVKAWVYTAPDSRAMVVAMEEHEEGHVHFSYAHLGEERLCPELFDDTE